MSATLMLDDDLEAMLRDEACQSGRPVAEIAAALLRTALAKPARRASATAFRIQPHQGVFAPGINIQKLNQLADELDTEAFLARQAQSR